MSPVRIVLSEAAILLVELKPGRSENTDTTWKKKGGGRRMTSDNLVTSVTKKSKNVNTEQVLMQSEPKSHLKPRRGEPNDKYVLIAGAQ